MIMYLWRIIRDFLSVLIPLGYVGIAVFFILILLSHLGN